MRSYLTTTASICFRPPTLRTSDKHLCQRARASGFRHIVPSPQTT